MKPRDVDLMGEDGTQKLPRLIIIIVDPCTLTGWFFFVVVSLNNSGIIHSRLL